MIWAENVEMKWYKIPNERTRENFEVAEWGKQKKNEKNQFWVNTDSSSTFR